MVHFKVFYHDYLGIHAAVALEVFDAEAAAGTNGASSRVIEPSLLIEMINMIF